MSDNITSAAETGGGPLGVISQAPPALDAFLDRNQTKLMVLAALLALGAVGYVIYDGIKKSDQETAGALLTKAEDISGLQDVVKNHGGTVAAGSANILLAEKQWEDGQQDDAIATLKTLVESEASHPAKPSATASLAAKLLSQGKAEEATEMFHKITEDLDARHLAPYAWISLGDIALAKGDLDEATKAYEAVERNFSDSPFAQQAMQRRLLLKAKDPVEVAAPIAVPETKLIDDAEGADAPSSDDLIEAIKGASGANPLLPQE